LKSTNILIHVPLIWLLILSVPDSIAQKLNKKITLEAHDQTLGDVIRLIGEKGDILFSYNPQSIPITKKITVVALNTKLSKIFDLVFSANEIDYSVSEKQVILKLRNKEIPDKSGTHIQSPRNFTISGYIRDKLTGDAIIGANVYEIASLQGITSNSYGFYSLSLPLGVYHIMYSFMGYTPVPQLVNLIKDINESVDLEVSSTDIKAIEILADPNESIMHINKSGEIRFSTAALKQIPGFAGNTDVIKTLQNVPGIVTFGDGSSFYFVRGGNSDQNLLLIDEAPIYNPSHLFGFFSALAPDAIKDVIVYKGDFPANYGGRLSSVVDVKGREGNLKRMSFAGNIGPFTSDLTLEGPILKDKSSFLISGRKSNLNWLQLLNDDQRKYTFNFYDINTKFNVLLTKNNRLFLTAFSGKDVFERFNKLNSNTFGISWKNVAGTLRWNHVFNNRLFSNTTAYFSRYDYFLNISKELRNYWTSSIANATLKTDFSWYLNPGRTLKTGFEINGHQSNPGNVYFTDAEIQLNRPHISEYQCSEIGIYASDELQIGQKYFIRYGIRLSKWNDLGPASIYYFDANHNVIDTMQVAKNTIYKSYLNIEPRINLKYILNNNSALTLNYSHNVQHLQVLSNSTSPFTSLEVWVPCGPNILPQQVDQFSMGYFSKVIRGQLDFSTEVYYKKLYNQIDYTDHANMLFNPLLEGELRFGDGWSYGIETLLRKSNGKLTGWISYAYSRSMKQITDVNYGKIFPATYDRPHSICITIAYATGKRWNISSHWMYLTGSPFTSPTGFYNVNGYSVPLYGKKNNDRYPDYHRLDLSLSFALSKPVKRFQHNLMLTVYNAYGRHNPFSVNFNKIMDDNGNIVVPVNIEGDFEKISTSISVSGAIPSLNYTFKF
jgi:hypothetical protein